MTPVEKMVRRFTPDVSVYSDGAELAIRCVFHATRDNTKRQLWISTTKRLFVCYRCNESGHLRKLLLRMKYLKPSLDVDPDAISEPVTILPPERDDEPIALKLPEEYRPLWGRKLGKLGSRALAYFKRRGFSEEQAELYRVGYCVDGYYSYRLIVPTYEEDRLVYFIARDFTGKLEKKVLNPRKEDGVTPGSKQCVFGLDLAAPFPKVYVHEGVFDAMATGLYAVALFGKTASEAQLKKILGRRFKTIVVCLDADAPDSTLKLARAFESKASMMAVDTDIRTVYLPSGDPATLPVRDLPELAI